jgi:hypothetical protein
MWSLSCIGSVRRVERYQRGNQNPNTEEEQTTQWPKEKSTKGQTTIKKNNKQKNLRIIVNTTTRWKGDTSWRKPNIYSMVRMR